MSIFDIKKSHAWNYSSIEKTDYCNTLTGTVVGIDNPQAYDFQTRKPRVWDDGSPVRNIRVFIKPVGTDDEVYVTFKPKGALFNAIGERVSSVADLIGHKVTFTTQPGTYGFGNPRPWTVEVGEVVEGAKLHKVPVLDYDTMNPVSGKPTDEEQSTDEVPF